MIKGLVTFGIFYFARPHVLKAAAGQDGQISASTGAMAEAATFLLAGFVASKLNVG